MPIPDFETLTLSCAKCRKPFGYDADHLLKAEWQGYHINGADEWFCWQCVGLEDANGKYIVQPRAVRTMLRIMPADFATHVGREPETQHEFDHFVHLAEESAMGHSINQSEPHDSRRWDSALAEAGRIISEDYRKRKG